MKGRDDESVGGVICVAVECDSRRRITIPTALRKAVGWLRGQAPPVECVISVGPERQLVLSAATSSLGERRREFLDSLRHGSARIDSTESRARARFFAATWQGAIQENYQLTLPKPPVESWSSQVVTVTLVALGDRLEIWLPAMWLEQISHAARAFDEIVESDAD